MTAETTRLDVAFPSSGDECRAWLFMPAAESPPLVILGHGLGGTREYGLEPYAQRFADAGIAALAFTYRHFGDSGGQPRQLLDIEDQLDDWAAALAYVATKFGVAGFSEAVAIELRGTGVEMSVVRPSLCNTELASGFAGLRGMPIIEPPDVAARIVKTLQRPRFDVPVPKSIGPMMSLNQALPFRARVALAHLTKADDVLNHIDAAERRLRRARQGGHMIRTTLDHPCAEASENLR